MTFCIFIQKRKFQIWKRKTNWGTKVNLLFVKITSNGKLVNFTKKKKKGETTILVPQVYPVCGIGSSSLKRAQLVPQVFKMSNISPFTNCH